MYPTLLRKCLLDVIYMTHDHTGNKVSDHDIDEGKYWPARAHTMIGNKRLLNIQYCFEDIIKNNIEGDLIETGVWRGGSTIFMAGLNKYYDQNRKIYVADSFEGLPPPDTKYPVDNGDGHHTIEFLAVSQEEVMNNFRKYDLLDENVIFIKGFFETSLVNITTDKLAILRLDGDMYSSTIQVLEQLYDKVQIGGYIIIDDYALHGCKMAVNDFRKQRNIKDEMIKIDFTGMFWKKTIL